MPGLCWEKFKESSGDVRINFENLCRGIVRAQFGGFGQFKALKNQPGVEYHIDLLKDCPSLGTAKQWFGWQCKWFELNKDKSLKAASKRDIEDSLDKTVKFLPNLTDWVLWTPFTLTTKDQQWFYGLAAKYPYSLHLWAEEDLDNWLAGPAEMLRKTYFGELVLSFETLKEQHERSIAPIKDRWLAPVHQVTDVESEVRRALATPTAYAELGTIRRSLGECKSNILKFESSLTNEAELLHEFISLADEYLGILDNLDLMLADGDIESLHEWLASPQLIVSKEAKRFVRLLRKRNLPIALDAANALDDMFLAKQLFEAVDENLNTKLIAILADAGGGKTQLSAQLSSTNDDGVYGVYIQGKFLSKTGSLDTLAKKYKINGASVNTFEELVFALNTAGQRAKCRLPIVIDGLNEAEDPRVWKGELASLLPVLNSAKNVLVVCTLRTGELPRQGYYERKHADQRESFAIQALPDDVTRIEMDGFGEYTVDAIRAYLHYYKIDAGDTELPINFFKRPITLRIYCEVTNPSKSSLVKVNQFPTSLPEIFGRYIDFSCRKISELSHVSQQYSEEDIRLALYYLGLCLWESNGRDCDEKILKQHIQDNVAWNVSLVNLLAQEGIIFRNPGDMPGQFELTPVYDALGGYLIADYLIQTNPRDRDLEWFKDNDVVEKFGGDNSHLLSSDIFRSLTSIVPKEFYGVQLWQLVPDEFKVSALLGVSEIEPKLIDDESKVQIEHCFEQYPELRIEIFRRLVKVRSNPANPLNSKFLTRLLIKLTVGERDLCWTEWLRKYNKEFAQNILKLSQKWAKPERSVSESDALIAEWLMWSLTTTNRQLRDDITKALYQFGLKAPDRLFQLVLESAFVNDPYIFERMLAAAYAVILDDKFLKVANCDSATKFASSLKSAFYAPESEIFTLHFIITKYVENILRLAEIELKANDIDNKQNLALKACNSWGAIKWEERIKHPFRMDFENYTIGRLIPSRGNYNYDHPGYVHVKEQMLWRVKELGWSDDFDQIDSDISSQQYHPRLGRQEGKIDRYGKKYAWIAYDEMVGTLINKGELEADWDSPSSEVDVSFLPNVVAADVVGIEALELDIKPDEKWLNSNDVPKNTQDYRIVEEDSSAFVLLDGTYDKQVREYYRTVFVQMRGYFVSTSQVDDLKKHFEQSDFSSNFLPERTPAHNMSFKEYVTLHDDAALTEGSFDFIVGSQQKEVESPRLNIGDGSLEIDLEDVVKQTIDVPVYHSIPCNCAAVSVPRSVSEESSGNARVVNRALINDFELHGSMQTFDLVDRDGKLATLLKGNQKNNYKNYEEFLYLRKDILDAYLLRNDLVLMHVNWGERQIRTSEDRNMQYKVFYEVEFYAPKTVIKK